MTELATPRAVALPRAGVSVWQGNIIVFISSFCALVLELVAGRVLAPTIGVSLYTWTSVIGVVLAGMSLGNFVGGRIADRFPQRTTLGVLLLLSGLLTLLTLPVIQHLTTSPPELPMVARIVFMITAIFFLPSALLGTISPVVIKLVLNDLTVAGVSVGRIYAFSTLGSIIGTFATGFVLVGWLGTRTIIAGVAIILVLTAVVFGDLSRLRRPALILVLGLFGAGFWWIDTHGAMDSGCTRESNYYCIKIGDTEGADGKPLKKLILDHLVHSFVRLDDPRHLEYGYEKIYAEIVRYLTEDSRPVSVLMIGAGGYTFPRYVRTMYPDSQVIAVEIDPEVTNIAYEQLALDPGLKIVSYSEDARQFLIRTPAQPEYDLVAIDAFNDISVPYHLTTVEFNRRIRASLKPGGMLVTLLIDNYQTGEFLQAYAKTMAQVFPYVYLMARGAAWDAKTILTWVVVASDQPLDRERFKNITSQDPQPEYATRVMPDEQLAEFIARGKIVLTDDFAPVDNMLTKVFAERGF